MPRGGAKPGERRGGRKRGSKNKATIEREHYEQQMRIHGEARSNRKLAKEVLEEFMHFAAGYAAKYRPVDTNPNKDEDKFKTWAVLACGWAKDLAPYQSPTYRAIAISPLAPEPEEDAPVLHTIEQVREYLITKGVPPDQFGKALIGPPMIEYEGEEAPEE